MSIFAYIDPAAGALIWQILAGVVITLGVVLGIWWKKITTGIKSIWAKLFGKKQSENQIDETAEEISDETAAEINNETK